MRQNTRLKRTEPVAVNSEKITKEKTIQLCVHTIDDNLKNIFSSGEYVFARLVKRRMKKP